MADSRKRDFLVPDRIHNAPPSGIPLPNLVEVWNYRLLLVQLVLRQFKIRYKQTVLGVFWAVVSPLITMVVFTFVFGNLAEVPSYDIPYPVFSFAGLVPWTLFAKGMTSASTSIVANASLVTKIYFPRLILPLASVMTGAIDFIIAFGMLLLLMLVFGFLPTINIIWVVFYVLLILITSLGIGLWLSSLHVLVRDIGILIPYMTQILLLVTPVAYPSNLLSEPWRLLYHLNPMVTVCDGFRWALLGTDSLYAPGIVVSTVAAVLLFLTGGMFFRYMESKFPDYI